MTRVVAQLQGRLTEEPLGRYPEVSPPVFPEAGDIFLEFHLVRELGRGAFGRVFLARQRGLAERLVALKIACDLHRESQTLAQLQHTNIVPIYSIHQVRNLQAFCMPYFGGATLAQVTRDLTASQRVPQSGRDLVGTIRGQRRSTVSYPSRAAAGAIDGGEETENVAPEDLPARSLFHLLGQLDYVQAILWLFVRLADGLEHAHSRGILHRDLKPANILVTDEGEPMLLDFNLAEDTKGNTAERASVGGTLPYMSPEQLLAFQGNKSEKLGPTSDVYSLGVILFELLTGRFPFPTYRGVTLSESIPRKYADRQGPPPRLCTLNPQISPAVEAIVRRCLEPDPRRRYQSALQLREDLQQHLQDRPLRHTPEPSLWERFAKFRRRHPRVMSTTSSLLVLFIGSLVVGGLFRQRGEMLANLQAVASAQALREDRRELEFLLTARSASNHVESALQRSNQALARFLQQPEQLDRLQVDVREQALADMRDLLWLQAHAHLLRVDPTAPEKRGEDLEEAEKLLQQAMSQYEPGAIPLSLRLQQARIARLQGQTEQADLLEKQAQEEKPRTARDWYLLAFSLAEAGKFRQALVHLDESLDRAPDVYNAWFLRGICSDALGRSEHSLASYTVCVALRPEFYAAYFNRGLAHARLRQLALARRDLDHVMARKPDFAEAYYNRALTFLSPEELPQAEADLTKSLALGFEQTRVYFARARIRDRLGNKDGARLDLAEGLRRQPTDVDSWVVRGLSKLPGDPAGALADIQQGLDLNPRSLPALQNKAHILVKYQKDIEGAIQVLDQAVLLYPEDVRPRAGRGVLLARLGRDPASLRDAQAALALDDDAANQYQVAGIYAQLSQRNASCRDQAFHLLRSALKKGFGADLLESDPDLVPLRADPRFARLRAFGEP